MNGENAMRLKFLLILSMLALVLSACTSAPPAPTPTSEASATIPPTSAPSDTALPSPTATETSAPTQALEPTIAPPPPDQSGVLATDQFSISAPAGVNTVTWNQVDGTPYDPNVPPAYNGLPPNLLVQFDDQAVDPSVFNVTIPQGRVLPVVAYEQMYAPSGNPYVEDQVQALFNLLIEKPAVPEGGLPVLPPLGAAQALDAQISYQSFLGGEGVAFVTYLSQGINPVENQNLFYFFQGLSTDSSQYVSFVIPISASILPDRMDQASQETLDAMQADYNKYLADTTAALNAAAPADFTPNLDSLNQMMRSMRITTGENTGAATQPPATSLTPALTTAVSTLPAATNTPTGSAPTATLHPLFTPTPTPVYAGADVLGTWNWVNLVASGDTVTPDDSDKYYVTFNADGSLSAHSDCNTAAGGYTLRRNDKITIDFTSGTTKDCGDKSKSSTFTNRLEDAVSYAVDGNRLVLTLNNGDVMRLSK
jgi:heat shock protein HslJ